MHNEPIMNGYMANTMKEIITLGKEMEHIKEQRKEGNRKPDPEQFDEAEQKRGRMSRESVTIKKHPLT